VATPPVEFATRTEILQLDGLASTVTLAAISSLRFLGAIVAQEVIKKEVGSLSALITNKIRIDKCNAPKVIGLASKSPTAVGAFNKIDTEWPDEMTPQRLQEYKVKVAEFRQRLKV
jgi:hypothetical protein